MADPKKDQNIQDTDQNQQDIDQPTTGGKGGSTTQTTDIDTDLDTDTDVNAEDLPLGEDLDNQADVLDDVK